MHNSTNLASCWHFGCSGLAVGLCVLCPSLDVFAKVSIRVCHDTSITILRGIAARKEKMKQTPFPEENSHNVSNKQPEVFHPKSRLFCLL